MNAEARLCTLCAFHVFDRGIVSCTKKRRVTDGSPVTASSRRMYPDRSCGTEGKEWEPVATLDERALALLADPTTSTWFRASLVTALSRDPVDVVNEAEALAEILADRARRALNAQAAN